MVLFIDLNVCGYRRVKVLKGCEIFVLAPSLTFDFACLRYNRYELGVIFIEVESQLKVAWKMHQL